MERNKKMQVKVREIEVEGARVQVTGECKGAMEGRLTVEKGRELKEASRRAFDAQAAAYDEGMFGRHARGLYGAVLSELERALTEQEAPRSMIRVLDLGCGTGALTEQVLAAFPRVEVHGIDLSEQMLGRARKRLASELAFSTARVSLQQGDAEHLPFGDGLFDAVYCCDSFHHYPNPERAMFEAWRVLAPGGVFIVADTWLPQPLRAVANAFMPYSGEGDVHMYAKREFCDLASRWFRMVDWRRLGYSASLTRAVK